MIEIKNGKDPDAIKVEGKLAIIHDKKIGFAEQQSAYPGESLYPSNALFPKNG